MIVPRLAIRFVTRNLPVVAMKIYSIPVATVVPEYPTEPARHSNTGKTDVIPPISFIAIWMPGKLLPRKCLTFEPVRLTVIEYRWSNNHRETCSLA